MNDAFLRHRYSFVLTLALLFSVCFTVKASHIYGADLFYEYLSNNNYKVSLVVYGDCGGSAFPYLDGAAPMVRLRKNGGSYSHFYLDKDGPGVEVTPVCPAMQNFTTCKDRINSIPGVKRYIYSKLVPMPDTCSDWLFIFDGQLGGGSIAGRSGSMSNITIGAGSVITLEAALNNTLGPNSSPQFTTIPTPFYCINAAQQYNQGAVDADNDSLAYALVPGRDALAGVGATVNYIPPYTATAPLATASGAFTFSSTTGQMTFTPNTVQQSLVVNQVREYRNGIQIGTASREMTFIVLNNCNNSVTSAMIDSRATASVSGGVRTSPTVFSACMSADSIRFDIVPLVTGSDTITASIQGLPAGASAIVTQNSTASPVITFIWKHWILAAGNYSFFITYMDNDCPLSSQQTQAFTIQVVKPSGLGITVISPTQCAHKALVEYRFSDGFSPRNISIVQGNTVVRTFTDNTGVVRDSLGAGQYIVNITSPGTQCASSYPISIADSGVYPYTPALIPDYYCFNDPSRQLTARPDSGALVHWYDAAGALLSGPPTPRTDTTGIFRWYASQHFKVCESPKDSVKVYVTKRPVASFTGPRKICLNDTASFSFTGAIGVGPIIEYISDWNGGVSTGSEEGPWKVHWYGPGIKIIRMQVAENKCVSFEVQDSISVYPMPYAGFYADFDVCLFDTLRVTYNTNPFRAQRYAWNFDGADIPLANGLGPYILRWNTAGLKRVSLTVDLDGCTDTRAQDIRVMPVPDVRITNAPGPVCIGDKIFLKATGGDKYVWMPQDSLLFSPDGSMYAQILKPTVYRVKAISDYGCIDSAAITYGEVEPCCNFAYPNAFSPNGDGRNDRFRVVTHGNQLRYELSIYNNWGQRVYYGLDPDEGWDGRFKGKPCDAGNYFYYLNATCFTGRAESHKGDLMLVK